MSQAGIQGGQFGIESLNTQALKAMNKNVTAWQNVQILKWCHEFGITPLWLFLHAFPGEKDELVSGNRRIGFPADAFAAAQWGGSGHVFFGIASFLTGLPIMGCSCSLARLTKTYCRYQLIFCRIWPLILKWRFKNPEISTGDGPDRPNFAAVGKALNRWVAGAKKDKPVLTWESDEAGIHVRDTRPVRVSEEFLLTGLDKIVYLHCDTAPREAELLAFCQEQGAGSADVIATVNRLCADKLLVRLDGRLLTLAVPAKSKPFAAKEDNPLGMVKLKEAMKNQMTEQRTGAKALLPVP